MDGASLVGAFTLTVKPSCSSAEIQIQFPNTSYGEDYALGLIFSRQYRIGRIYSELYLCRRCRVQPACQTGYYRPALIFNRNLHILTL